MRIRTLEHADHETMADRWLAALAQSRADLLAILSDLTHEELHARITPSAHSVAEYLWHIANVSLWWTKSVVLGEPISEEEKARFGLTRPGEILKAPAEKRLDEFLDLLAETMALVESVYRHMPDDVFTTADRPLGEESVSPEWVLYNLLDHEANHRGQIAMMKRILRTE